MKMVGAIAAAGFVIGLVWPRLAGVSLVPEAPIEEARASAAEEAQGAEGLPAAPGEGNEASEVKQLTPEDTLEIGEPEVTSCRDAQGKEQKTCDGLAIDDVLHAPLRALTSCPGAEGAFGVLSLGIELEFGTNRVGAVKSGRSTKLPKTALDELLRCAKKELASVQLDSVKHDHTSYSVYYRLLFKTPEAALAEQATIAPMSGHVLVRWKTALVRETPERTAKVRERVLSGARLVVTGRQGEWYRVKYDAKGREGWVHGAALGAE